MKTKIYKTKADFQARKNKLENGVSPEFAEANEKWQAENETNEGCYDCSRCSDCSGCSDCSRCSRCSDCSGCYDCSRCSDCSGCYDCSGCSDCSRCSDCSGKKELTPNIIEIPSVEKIHAKVLAAVSNEGAFEMNNWHTCKMTHCRGGWVVTLAGEAGAKLESQTSSEFAAMAIYNKSSPIKVSPVRFYESNEVAMADIMRCAKAEAEL